MLFQSPTIAALAELVGAREAPSHRSSLIPVQPKGDKPAFFWVHGDSSNVYLPAELGDDRPLYALEHQSLDGRPARHMNVGAIATHYLREMRAAQANGPYLLGGYSFGAAVAFEMARQLTEQGEQVPLLFMLAPPGREKCSPSSGWVRLQELTRDLAPLGFGAKAAYLGRTIGASIAWRTAQRRNALAKRLATLRSKAYVRAGALLPPSLRSRYILDIYRDACGRTCRRLTQAAR